MRKWKESEIVCVCVVTTTKISWNQWRVRKPIKVEWGQLKEIRELKLSKMEI